MTLKEKKEYDFNMIKEWKKITDEEESIKMRNKILINLKLLVYKVANCLSYIKSFEKEELIDIGFMGLIKGLNYIKYSKHPITVETYTKHLFYSIKYYIFRELDRFLHGKGWGLIWYDKDTDKFRLKKKSGVFKIDKGLECRLLVNALKRYKSGYTKSILLKDYLEYKE